MLWQPEKETHEKFPVQFQEVVRTMLRGIRDERSALSALHPDVLMYIFNKHVGWEWFGKDMPAWTSRFPALATSCRSRSVDLIIDVIIDHVTHFFDKAEGTSNKPRVMVVACQMARTIVSKSDALRSSLTVCSMHIRIRALLYIAKSCYEKIVNRKSELRCEQRWTGRGKIPPRLLVECIPEALAHDATTVYSVSNFICTFVRSKEGWEGLQTAEEDANIDAMDVAAAVPIDKDSAEYKEAYAALTEFMRQLHLISPVVFFQLSTRASQPNRDEVYLDDLSPDEDDMDSDFVDDLDYDDEVDYEVDDEVDYDDGVDYDSVEAV